MRLRTCLIFIVIVSSCLICLAQEVDLQTQQQALNSKIDKSNAYLTSLNTDQLNTVQQLVILEENITDREALIASYGQSALLAEQESIKLVQAIDSLAALSEASKQEYYTLMAEVHKKNKLINPAQLLFSQHAFSSLIRRNVLAGQYHSFIKSKEKEYQNHQASYDSLLIISNQTIQENLELRDASLQEQAVLKVRYENLRSLKDNLKSQAANIKSAIASTKQERLQVNNTIESYIQTTIDKQEVTPSHSFSNYSLPWPIDGTVVSKFGRHRHPTLPDIYVINNGIDIAPYTDRTVRSSSHGEVIKIENHHSGYLILVKHDNYYLLYSQLSSTTVSIGSQVIVGSILGEIEDELHFEIWDGKSKEDPSVWLVNK